MIEQTRVIMGMPITIALAGDDAAALEGGFVRFAEIDARFSPFRPDSEVERLNDGRLDESAASGEFREILALGAAMHARSGGYFDVRRPDGRLDPSGVVKGWAARQVAERLAAQHRDFLVDAGGDVQVGGARAEGAPWRVGIRNPFDLSQIVKIISPGARGVATSGSYVRGHHIYDPLHPDRVLDDIVSVTVVAADVLEADLLATAAFAMGRDGIAFLRGQPGVDFYIIDREGRATFTAGFAALVPA